MDFSSNLRVSNKASSISNFQNTNAMFRIDPPSNEIFQQENSKLSISSITYPNRFKILPSYLKSNVIKILYMYSDDHFSNTTMGNVPIEKDISPHISNDPKVLFKNFNNKLFDNFILWNYDEQTNKCKITSSKNAYLIQIPIPFANMIGLYKDEVNITNDMILNHLFKSDWYYNFIYTENFMKVMKEENNVSVYEFLNKKIIQLRDIFIWEYLTTTNIILSDLLILHYTTLIMH